MRSRPIFLFCGGQTALRTGTKTQQARFVYDSNKLMAVPMAVVRSFVEEAFPFLKERALCDIDVAMVYDGIVRAEHGFHVAFPRRQPNLAVGKDRGRNHRVCRSRAWVGREAVKFDCVFLTT